MAGGASLELDARVGVRGHGRTRHRIVLWVGGREGGGGEGRGDVRVKYVPHACVYVTSPSRKPKQVCPSTVPQPSQLWSVRVQTCMHADRSRSLFSFPTSVPYTLLYGRSVLSHVGLQSACNDAIALAVCWMCHTTSLDVCKSPLCASICNTPAESTVLSAAARHSRRTLARCETAATTVQPGHR
jgi:hypothetical protein